MSEYKFLENISKEDFNAFAKNNIDTVKTHFLGSYEWGELSRKRNATPYYVGVEQNGEIVATALLLEKPLIMGYTHFYCPRGFTLDYSRFDLIEFFSKEIINFCKSHKALYFKIDPDIRLRTVNIDGEVIPGESNEKLVNFLTGLGYKHRPLTYAFETMQPRFTFRIDISGTMDEIESRYSKTTLHEIRKSEESEVIAYKGSRDDISEFIRLMKMTEARQNFYSHESDYYYTFYDYLDKSGMVDIYIGKVDIDKLKKRTLEELEHNNELKDKLEANPTRKAQKQLKEINNRLAALNKKITELESKPSGEVVASSYLVVKYLDKYWTLYGANDMDYSKYFVNYAVYQKMIVDANAQGYKVFDGFGTIGRKNMDTNAIGLYEFKKKWGGELTEFVGEFDYIINKPVYLAYSKLIPIYHNIKLKKLKAADKANS